MVRRALSLLLLAWLFGFLSFAVALPRPHPVGRTDAVIVLTGGKGRIEHGLDVLRSGRAAKLLVSGVDREVTPEEFREQYTVSAELMRCCVTLGFDAYDTRSNAHEAVRWLEANHARSVRLVTTDWHMRRARFELGRSLPRGTAVVADAVASQPTLRALFREYNKLLLRLVVSLWES